MKEVNLVTFEVEKIVVDDYRNILEFDLREPLPNMIRNSMEYVPHFVEVETTNIELVVDQGIHHYMAVSKKVWEYLYVMKNPITGATQQAELETLRNSKALSMVTIDQQAMRIKNMARAGFWTRLKWLFTGVRL